MSIFDVQHQGQAHRVIQQALACRRMPHAYLFCGPEGVGREMLALRLAALLLCASPVRRAMPEDVRGKARSPEDRVNLLMDSKDQVNLLMDSKDRVNLLMDSKDQVNLLMDSKDRVNLLMDSSADHAEEQQQVASVLPQQQVASVLGDSAGGSAGAVCGSGEASDEALDACGQCDDCRLVAANTHPDLFLIHRQLNRHHPESKIRKQKALFLGVEVIRHFVIDRAGTRPSRGRAKVFILREAERLSEEAENSLLKTLEEPPDRTILILITTGLDRMLPTTRSRCQPVMFRSLPADFVADKLRELRPEVTAEAAAYLARHCGGSLGAAIRQIDDQLYPAKHAWGQRLMHLLTGGSGEAPHTLAGPFLADAKVLAKGVSERDPDVSDTDANRAGLQALLSALADFLSDGLRHCTGADVPAINSDQPEVVAHLATLGGPALDLGLRRLAEADTDLGRNAHIDLTLETMFVRLAAATRAGRVDRGRTR